MRVWIETSDTEGETFIRNRVAIHPLNIYYYEEFNGSGLETYTTKKLSKITLLSGEVVVVEESFESLVKKMADFRKQQSQSGFFKQN